MFVIKQIKYYSIPVVGAFAVAFILFANFYFTGYQDKIGPAFFKGAGDAINYAAEQTEGKIYMTTQINAPYITALFYQKTDPKVFIDTVDYQNPDSECRVVRSFDRFVTGIPKEIVNEKNAAFVVGKSEVSKFSENEYQLTQFDYYTVAIKR